MKPNYVVHSAVPQQFLSEYRTQPGNLKQPNKSWFRKGINERLPVFSNQIPLPDLPSPTRMPFQYEWLLELLFYCGPVDIERLSQPPFNCRNVQASLGKLEDRYNLYLERNEVKQSVSGPIQTVRLPDSDRKYIQELIDYQRLVRREPPLNWALYERYLVHYQAMMRDLLQINPLPLEAGQ